VRAALRRRATAYPLFVFSLPQTLAAPKTNVAQSRLLWATFVMGGRSAQSAQELRTASLTPSDR